jgi:hypothetical protein
MASPRPRSVPPVAGAPVWLHPTKPELVQQLSAVRSTLVAAGAESLRALHLYDRYLENLAEPHRSTLRLTVAGSWLSLDVMTAHYAACDSLGLAPERVLEIGRGIGTKMNDLWAGLMRSIVKTAGVTPWSALDLYGRFWSRMFVGGGVALLRQGPKEAIVSLRELPIAPYAYFRGTFCGVHERILGMLCSKIYVRVVASSLTPSGFDLRLSWV